MMRSEGCMATGTRRRYPCDFAQEAVRLAQNFTRPVDQVARDVGISEHVWIDDSG